jgi:urea ABC transporter ATP-binding protein UrtE
MSRSSLLDIKGLGAGYGRVPVLHGVDFHVNEGEIVGVLGHNGMGKTTLLKTIMGLLPATAGSIVFDGEDVTSLPAHERNLMGLAYVPQGREIIPHLTVHQNLLLGYWNRPVIPGDVPEQAAFEEVYQLFPKLTQILHRPGGVLSGGEQQQLAIGRAILSSPTLLLLDEPTEGIQPSIVDQIEDVIIGFKQSRRFAILLVEQGLHFAARLAEKYVVMAKGAVMAQGKSTDLNADMVRQHLTV